MSNAITRTYTFANGGVADGGQVDSEFQNIVNTVNNADAGITAWTNVVTGVLTSTGVTTLKGSTTNDNAAAGNIGEEITSTAGPINSTGSAQYFDVTSIALTAGDWDVSAIVDFAAAGATVTVTIGGIGTVTGNSNTGLVNGDTASNGALPTAVIDITVVVPPKRISINGPVTYYLKALLTYSGGGPPTAMGRISARRVR